MQREVKIVFVEDEPTSVDFMVRALKASGYSPEWIRVENARDFEVALQSGPDIIIADYYVPDFYGIDVLFLMDHFGLDIPVVVVSAALPEGSEKQIVRLGASDFVRKDQLGRLGKVVYDAIAARDGVCEIADRETATAETRGLV